MKVKVNGAVDGSWDFPRGVSLEWLEQDSQCIPWGNYFLTTNVVNWGISLGYEREINSDNNWWHKITWGVRLCYFISDEDNFTPRGSKIGSSINKKKDE